MWATVLKVETPACAWCTLATRRHPDVGVRVTQYYPRPEKRALEVVELTGIHWREAVEEVRRAETVDEVEVLEEAPDRAQVRISARECFLPHAIEASGVVPQTPFSVELGCDRWLLLAPKPHAREFYESLSKEGAKVDVLFSGEYAPEARLTDRQQEVLALAVAWGYYDYPRRITLSKLAERAGVAKSTLSQTLMLVERQVMQKAVADGALGGHTAKPR